jgi:hypothetical protein
MPELSPCFDVDYRGTASARIPLFHCSTESLGGVSTKLFCVFPRGGDGYLAGETPGGLTTLEDVPVVATVRVLYRGGGGKYALDGALMAQTESAADGTWRVDGLNPDYRYDVVGRLDGYNDAIQTRVQPIAGGGGG